MKTILARKCTFILPSQIKTDPLSINTPHSSKNEADNNSEEDTSSDEDASHDKDEPGEPRFPGFRTPIIEDSYFKPQLGFLFLGLSFCYVLGLLEFPCHNFETHEHFFVKELNLFLFGSIFPN